MTNILDGVRILDLTRVMSGPYCTSMLADLGAEVIKIEMPEIGDEARHMGPFIEGHSTYFAMLNRDKKSVTVNLKTPEGQKIIKQLVERCDVLVENFRPGVMARYNLSYDDLKAINPKLIYASISGFGADSPLAAHPALDIVIQAMSGLMSVTGEENSRALMTGESMADVSSGIFAAFGIVAALFNREKKGQGQHIDVAMFDSVFAMLLTGLSQQLYLDKTPAPMGNRHPVTYPVDSFPTRTGDIVLCCFTRPLFEGLCDAMARPELKQDDRFRDNAARSANDNVLRAIITQWTQNHTKDEVLAALGKAGIPAAPVQTLAEAAASEHAKARDLVQDGHHAGLAQAPLVQQPLRFSSAPRPSSQTTPILGEHTREVLTKELSLDQAKLDDYAKRGII
jgi:CoA:oxalate CoA-transferase